MAGKKQKKKSKLILTGKIVKIFDTVQELEDITEEESVGKKKYPKLKGLKK